MAGAELHTDINVHLEVRTVVGQDVLGGDSRSPGAWPFAVITIGDGGSSVKLLAHDPVALWRLGEIVERARLDLADALGVLPTGEPCRYAGLFGEIEWNEHDHEACLAELVDEPPAVGTAWERHDDPTVSGEVGD